MRFLPFSLPLLLVRSAPSKGTAYSDLADTLFEEVPNAKIAVYNSCQDTIKSPYSLLAVNIFFFTVVCLQLTFIYCSLLAVSIYLLHGKSTWPPTMKNMWSPHHKINTNRKQTRNVA